uniref:CCHC-type domain-containing protein n=1 Tax=Anopheles atroparvus TaxID=41427 RepID=A0AAG5DR34_ANOAO
MAGWKILKKRGTIADLLERVRACEIETSFTNTSKTTVEVSAVLYNAYPKTASRPKELQSDNFSYRQKQYGMQEARGYNKGGFSGFATNRSYGIRRFQCWRCNSNSHQPENCYAIDKRCRSCQTIGHIERACRSGFSNKGKRYSVEENEPLQQSKTRKIAAITESENTESTECQQKSVILQLRNSIDSNNVDKSENLLFKVNQGEGDKVLIVGYVAGIPINFMIDSGADVNTIDTDSFDSLIKNIQKKLIFLT